MPAPLLIALAFAAPAEGNAAPSLFHPPVPLTADGAPIDRGEPHGHAGPAATDFDGDGDLDLIVGDFGGTFTLYRNDGSRAEPALTEDGPLTFTADLGGNPVRVPIYCCVGSSPQFADLTGDGTPDLLSGSYDPGCVYLFPGADGGRFGQLREDDRREELTAGRNVRMRTGTGGAEPGMVGNASVLADADGRGLFFNTDPRAEYEAFGSFPFPVDWDADGDFDLLVGGFDGSVRLFENRGTAAAYSFAPEPMSLTVGGEPLEVAGHHAAVVAADWDGDGVLDLVSGSDDGGAVLFRGTAAGSMEMAPAVVLVAPPATKWVPRVVSGPAGLRPGTRTQVAVTDWDGDGQLDLLLGDHQQTLELAPGAADDPAVPELLAKWELRAADLAAANVWFMAERQKLWVDIAPEDQFKDAVQERVTAATDALRERDPYKSAHAAWDAYREALSPYLAAPPEGTDTFDDGSRVRGHVWLFRRR